MNKFQMRGAPGQVRQTKSSRKRKNKRNKKNVGAQLPTYQRSMIYRQGIPKSLNLNFAQSTGFAAAIPLVFTGGSTPGGVVVSGRELYQTSNSGSTTLAFGADNTSTATGINMRPGNFTRLGSVAQNWDEYFFREFRVQFISNQPTTAAGTCMIAFDVDVGDSTPTTSTSMFRKPFNVASNIYSALELQVPTEMSAYPKYFNNSGSVEGTQQNQGEVYYAFEGVAAVNAPMGYMIVDYVVELFSPQ